MKPSIRKCGHSSATVRWTSGVDGRAHHAGARGTRQPHLRHQLQPAAARWPGARQRQDIQELEAAFLGAGWNVIKVLWGSRWDPLLARDHQGLLRRVMEECVDGEYQNFKAKGGAYTREHFFGKYPELKAMVANMSDEEIWRLNSRRPRPAQGVCGLRRRRQPPGAADRDSGEDREGLRPRQGRRGADDRPPAEETLRGGPARVP